MYNGDDTIRPTHDRRPLAISCVGMSDHEEDQAMEVEALESIFEDDFTGEIHIRALARRPSLVDNETKTTIQNRIEQGTPRIQNPARSKSGR